MTPRLNRQLELCADAVIRGHEQGIGIARGLEVEEASEPAEFRVRARPRRRPGKWADALHEGVAGFNGDAGVRVSQGLLAHCERALETSRLDFHAVVAKRRGECSTAALSSPSCCCSPPLESPARSMRSWRRRTAASFLSTAQAR